MNLNRKRSIVLSTVRVLFCGLVLLEQRRMLLSLGAESSLVLCMPRLHVLAQCKLRFGAAHGLRVQ